MSTKEFFFFFFITLFFYYSDFIDVFDSCDSSAYVDSSDSSVDFSNSCDSSNSFDSSDSSDSSGTFRTRHACHQLSQDCVTRTRCTRLQI